MSFSRQLEQLQQLLTAQQMHAAVDLAEELYQLAQQTSPKAAEWDQLAFLLGRLHRHTLALNCYQRALALAPNSTALHFNCAMTLRFLGRSEAALDSVNRALALAPHDSEALALRSDLFRQSEAHNHVAELQTCLRQQSDPVHRTRVLYALAKELEDLGRYAQSFDVLAAGAQLRRQRMRYDVNNDIAVMNTLQATFNSQFFSSGIAGYDCAEPVFILGMPRVGSTLLERMLSNHSQIQSAGELDNFAAQMMAQLRARGAASGRENLVAASRELDFAALGEAYVESTRPLTGQRPFFIDKLPLNFLYIGLIAAALPGATIIHITRNPMDSCYAMYKRLFNSAYPFSYQLDELAQYYAAYGELMNHWRHCLGERVIEVSYEDLVAAPETTLEPVLRSLNLTTEPAVLNFTSNRSASTTASASQVRQGLYSSSVDKWRHYEKQLRPLREQLTALGVAA